MRFSGGAWSSVGPAGFTPGMAAGTTLGLALDSADTPYVAYTDSAASDKATVMRYSGGAWAAVGGAGVSAGSTADVSFAIDSSDALYLAYQARAATALQLERLSSMLGAGGGVGGQAAAAG